ncbi:MarR family transcriptional regulator [Erysipelotrichaceae bacterium OttesenSCG-928-M19]|nr:MarR family transcriptional regulator [Erysipelotrichaceae bacterium OttesenSCG-928-M19]
MNTGYLLISVAKKLRYQLNSELQKIDITSQQWAVIINIDLLAANGIVTLIDIAKHLEIDKPTMTGIINRLEKKKLINKSKHPTDNRAHALTLSNDGRKILKDYQSFGDDVLNNFLEKISPAEQQQLHDILDKLNK